MTVDFVHIYETVYFFSKCECLDMIEKGDEGEIHSVVESKDPALNFDKNR